MNPRYLTSVSELDNLVGLSKKDREEMESVTELFPFRANDYYLSLIDWKDGNDPLRRIVVPHAQELAHGGCADPSHEQDYTKQPGLQHKYNQTGLLLLTDTCAGICRFCFRKRLFMSCKRETVRDVSDNIEYIREHKEITNVLLTGGDPLTLSTRQLEPVLKELREIEHVNIIRIGSKMLAYNPYRILNDPNSSPSFPGTAHRQSGSISWRTSTTPASSPRSRSRPRMHCECRRGCRPPDPAPCRDQRQFPDADNAFSGNSRLPASRRTMSSSAGPRPATPRLPSRSSSRTITSSARGRPARGLRNGHVS